MTEPAIWVNGLSKKFTLGESRNIRTFGETLNDFILSPFRVGSRAKPRPQSFWALKDVSFELQHGKALGIIGRNGSGKSTLLRILSRITRPTEGSLKVSGRLRSLLEVGVGFHPELTGRENIYLNGSILGMRRVEIERRFDEIVAFSGIERFIDTPVKYYSSGMYVRLAFSASVHFDPDILLVDEVLAVGDVEFQKKCLNKLAQLRQQGRTIVLISHMMTSVADLSSQVIWLDSGRIVAQGDPRSVISDYMREQTSGDLTPIGTENFDDSEPKQTEPAHVEKERSIPLGSIAFEPAQGSDRVKVHQLWVADPRGRKTSRIGYQDPVTLNVDYEVTLSVRRMHVGLRLYNERGQRVLLTVSSDCSFPDGQLVGEPGLHRLSTQIPGSWLSPGRYSIELGVASADLGTHFHRFNALAFDVVGMPFSQFEQEVLRPSLSWHITNVS